ncbi:MAG: DUF2059 domain-containing protein [Roseiarcus sp.]
MFSSQSKIKASLAAIVVLAISIAGARADEPTPAALNYANQILVDVGIKPSLDMMVPEMLSGLDRNITATRPELKDSLRATLVAIEPEFVKSEQGIVAESAKFLASRMTEQELKDTVTFFDTPSGKKYLATQPVLVQQVGQLARAWREQLSTDILARAHEEMKKKGTDF